MSDNRFERIWVYYEWESIFSIPENSRLRKQKAIRAVVERYKPGLHDPDVVETLQSLLKENVFESRSSAARAFPELFASQAKPDATAPIPVAFGMDGPSKELLTSFKQLYVYGDYADLTITCHGRQHQVHKAIVCPRSDFFAAACRGGMKEARTGIIDLPDDDPQVVDVMVYYFYHLDYNTPPLRVIKDAGTPGPSTDNVEEKATEQGGISDVDSDDDVTASHPRYSDLVVHAKVYALAGKYFISSLKALALQKFEAAAQKKWAPDDFLEAAQEAYTSTPDSDRGMRDVVVKTLYRHRNMLGQESTQDVLKKLDGLAYDLLIYVHRNVARWQ